MQIECCHKGMACSTLILGGFNNSYLFNEFCENLRELMETKVSDYYKWYPTHQYSFVLASTLDVYDITNSNLTRLGFTSTPIAYNGKNGTNVILWTIPVDTLLKNLKKNQD